MNIIGQTSIRWPLFLAVLWGPILSAQPTKIMPLGDSITQSDSTHDSFRRPLWQKLQFGGNEVDFVGSLQSNYEGGPPNPDFDLDHEGHWGWRADEILAHVDDWAAVYSPDIVLLHLGTNDILQGESVSSTINELSDIIDALRAANPEVIVLLAQLIPHALDRPGVEALNSQIPALAAAKNSARSPVVAVDHHSGFDPALDTFDGVHPNASGEEKMAQRWYEALAPLLQVADTSFSVDRGFFDEAFTVEITSATPGATIRYTTDSSAPTETHGAIYAEPIEISTTTVLRAAAFKEGFEPTNVDTQTYIFLADIIRQRDQAPDGAFWDTEMDSDVVDDPRYRSEIIEALTAIPTLSVVSEPADLFSPSGIHWGDNLENRDLEVPCSIELIYPDGAFPGFQEDAGLRIQGGGGRWSEGRYDPKQSFTVKFQRQYGKAKLEYPFFESAPLNRESATREFDRIILRAGHNKSWSGPGPGDREWVTYARDQWARDTHTAMSGLDSHGTFMHLYLNGLYWGLYNPVERPDHNFMAAYYGGDGEDYYVKKKKGGSQTGSSARYQQMQSIISSTSRPYDEIREYLDTANYIDFNLVLWANGVADLQWYSGNCNNPPGPVHFWVWDAEDSWDPGGRANDGYRFFEESDVFGRIKNHPEFQMELADRIYKHCFHGGALTDTQNIERWLTLNAYIEKAIIGESARWGDQRQHPPLNRDDHWYAARDMVARFMEGNTANMVADLKARGYYPDLEPPRMSQFGGPVIPYYELVLENPNPGGTIFYTVDGADPRVVGSGGVHDTARNYTSPLHIAQAAVVKARVRDGEEWSALAEATFFTLADRIKLRLTEIMYHPWVNEGLDDKDYEFLELKNVGVETLDLSGCRFREGIEYTFPFGTRIKPGAFVVLVSDAEAFASRYPDVEISGEYKRHLSNAGERVRLDDVEGNAIFDVLYLDDSPWPESADGGGLSLVPTNATPVGDPNDPEHWRESVDLLGSPGADDGVTLEEAPLIHRPPRDLTVADGESALFTVWAMGVPLPRYQWQRDGVDIPAADQWYHFIPAVSLVDSGSRFRCVVSNSQGQVTSADATLTVFTPPVSGEFVSVGSRWRYFRGTEEASAPRERWRNPEFDDAEWPEGSAPFGYGDPPFGTLLSDMEDSYSTLFLRQRFGVPAGRQVTALAVRADYDDGFIAWINGEEVLRINVSAGTEAHDAFASGGHESGNYTFFSLAGPYDYLRSGDNVIAIQAFNVDLSSSDLKIDASLVFEAIDIPEEPPPKTFRRGDANADEETNLSDAVSILNFLFLGGPSPPCEKSADVDDSGDIDISDGIHVLRYLFMGGLTLPPPFPDCGLDPTLDSLTCEDFVGCSGE